MPVTPGPATPTSAGLVQVAENDGPLPTALGLDGLGRAADLAGAQAATRYVGGTDSGSPTTGTFAPGDFVVDGVGEIWVCTTAGTPGTWVALGEGAALGPAVSVIPDPTQYPTLLATTPTPPTTLAAGTYHVGFCYTTAGGGRTRLSKTASITITGGQGITATAPALPDGVSGIEFYIDDCAPVGPGNSFSGGLSYGVLSSQSFSGCASYGVLSSQSFSGCASYGSGSGGIIVSGMSFQINAPGNNTTVGLFIKVNTTPTADSCVADVDCGSNGYVRVKLTTTLHLVMECSFLGVTSSVDINGSAAVSVGSWYFIRFGAYSRTDYSTGYFQRPNFMAGQVWSSGGSSPGVALINIRNANGTFGVSYTAVLSVGHSHSGGGLADMPNTTAVEMSKVAVDQQNVGDVIAAGSAIPGPPAADESPVTSQAYYACRQATGSAAQLTDGSSNAYHLVSVGAGVTINAEGPYP